MTAEEDEGLRRRAVDRLGALAPNAAREALESGSLEIERNVLAWEGSLGTIRAHLVILRLEDVECARIKAAPSAVDALTAAIASAIAEAPGEALAELVIAVRTGPAPNSTPYRGRRV